MGISKPLTLPTQGWLLDFEGRISGPFSMAQIRSFLTNQEIQPNHKVTSIRTQGSWITAGEAVDRFGHTSDEPTIPNLSDQTPAMLHEGSTPAANVSSAPDESPSIALNPDGPTTISPAAESGPTEIHVEIPVDAVPTEAAPPRKKKRGSLFKSK